jgi:hypothetical protein
VPLRPGNDHGRQRSPHGIQRDQPATSISSIAKLPPKREQHEKRSESEHEE